MLKVGLTGGIATGKTFVSGILKKLGAYTIDADTLSREVVLPRKAAFYEIVRQFGKNILDREGCIDRQALGKIVFSDRQKLRLLEEIVHPEVIKAQDRWLEELAGKTPSAIAVVDAPLLIEAGVHEKMDTVIIVVTTPETQIKRALARGAVSKEEVVKRIEAQMPLSEKTRYGDFIIDNNGSRMSTKEQVTDLWPRLNARTFPGHC
ncbi:MAG: dephospho-CoA kinase [Nitrospinota bacterium]